MAVKLLIEPVAVQLLLETIGVKTPFIFGDYPNNYGTGVGLATNNNGQFIYSGWSGALTPKNNAWSGYERQPDQTNRDFGTEFELNFSKGNAIYSDSISTVQVDALLGQYLIRYAA